MPDEIGSFNGDFDAPWEMPPLPHRRAHRGWLNIARERSDDPALEAAFPSAIEPLIPPREYVGRGFLRVLSAR